MNRSPALVRQRPQRDREAWPARPGGLGWAGQPSRPLHLGQRALTPLPHHRTRDGFFDGQTDSIRSSHTPAAADTSSSAHALQLAAALLHQRRCDAAIVVAADAHAAWMVESPYREALAGIRVLDGAAAVVLEAGREDGLRAEVTTGFRVHTLHPWSGSKPISRHLTGNSRSQG